ncbi:hypothetical protein AB5I39_03555 [Sphingomonas sp. MMS24-J45]|uniref:hypothetical protein n=1 Tax=Sphingomonas sp. MMS24-J45 TaxID=3238806 RepID=UPI0038500368
MSHGEPWATLDIAPTHDAREVRRAYSKRLKAIDVEAEPERFVALREAFEYATALANMGEGLALADATPEPTTPLDDRWSGPEEADWDRDRSSAPHPDTSPLEPGSVPNVEDNPIDLHAEALQRLLLSHPDDWLPPAPEETEAMLAHWAAISADSRLEELSFYANAEIWVAEVVARGCPFSDPLVPLVIARFGWLAAAGKIGQHPAVEYVLARNATLNFLQEVSKSSHPLHGAWKELTTPATERSRRGWGTTRKSVRTLLQRIREEHPDAEKYLDSWRVGLWENAQSGSGRIPWSAIAFGFIVLFQFARYASMEPAQPQRFLNPPVMVDRLTDRDADIDRALFKLSDNFVGVETVRIKNPSWYSDLSTVWENQKLNKHDLSDFEVEVSKMVAQRFSRVRGKAPYAQIKAYRAIDLQSALYYKEMSPQQCYSYLVVGDQPVRPSLQPALRRAIYDIVLSAGADVTQKSGNGRFTVPGDVMEQGAKKAGLSRNAYGVALNDGGTIEQRCNARIALLQVALELPPKRGLKLLREM